MNSRTARSAIEDPPSTAFSSGSRTPDQEQRSATKREIHVAAGRLERLYAHALDLRAGRPHLSPEDQAGDGVAVALGLRLDGAVGAIAHPAAEPEPPGLALHRSAKPDALDEAGDHELDAADHACSSIRRNSPSS